MGDQLRIPRVVITVFYLSPPPLPFPRTAELPSLCNVVLLFINFLFLISQWPYLIMFIHLPYRINKQRDTSFEFSSILSTVDLSKHLITAWIIRKFIQLVNFVTFSVFFFFFGNRLWLKLHHERALSGASSFLEKRSCENLLNAGEHLIFCDKILST